MKYDLICAKYFPESENQTILKVLSARTLHAVHDYMDRRARSNDVYRIGSSLYYVRKETGVVVSYRAMSVSN